GLRSVPNIASCHHEKIDGSGYPWGLTGDEIPLAGRILALVDIFEALTAKDRSYKPAFPVERALGILEQEVDANHIDSRLFRLFREREIYMMFIDKTGYVSIKESLQDEPKE
ncbi:MAG: HD domain-containing phosphohydrolase, partial [Planctomycetota bacterium]|nr:HD domain-containing phosphohydrolase [Planctomycetota bacterium]